MIIRDKVGIGDLSAAEFSQDFNFGFASKLVTVFIHSDTALTEEITITYVSAKGTEYDTVIKSRVLSSESDYIFAAQGDIAINEDDSIRVEITNANLVGEVGVTVKVEV